MAKTSTIQLAVTLGSDNIPEKITWKADDNAQKAPEECKAFMLSLFDGEADESLRIDLWTNEMRQDEMDKFFFETFLTMADTYKRANTNEEVTTLIKDFAFQFGEKVGLLKRKE
ncbi:MAG TPA: gliding motility protein GldC [Chitinophagales bacterium]|jgi:gliding motility-associated protein GldC|nr:gliding motility protein GldC [Chitinophagales bacterium]